MATLGDRLDYIVGAKAAKPLDEVFAIRTVDELLRHYPRSYVEGTAVRGADDEPPVVGAHVTLVDVIADALVKPMKPRAGQRRDEYLKITLGSGNRKVTATFFHAKKWIKHQLTKGTRVMLSGEVGYFKATMQLTHPAYLVLDSPDGAKGGSRSLRMIAEASEAVTGEVLQAEFERSCYPIYPASTKLQSWDIFSCVRQVLAVLDPVPDPLPETLCAKHRLISQDEALRAIHLAEDEAQRLRARDRLAFDEAVALQWALVGRLDGELSQSGLPAQRRRPGGRVVAAAAVRVDRGATRSARRVDGRAGCGPPDEPDVAG